MSDARLRELELAWRASGAVADGAAWRAEGKDALRRALVPWALAGAPPGRPAPS